MNLNNIFEITTISILIIIYFFGVLTYLVFGYLFLINDYKIANECKDSSLWVYILVNIITTTFGFVKMIIKKETTFEQFGEMFKNELTILLAGIILAIFYSGFICWGGVELFKNSCNDLQKTSLWKFGLFTFSFQTMWFVIACLISLNYKKVNNFFNGDENQNQNNDEVNRNNNDELLRRITNLNYQIDDIITRTNSQNVQASPVTEVDISQINLTPTANVEIITTENNPV